MIGDLLRAAALGLPISCVPQFLSLCQRWGVPQRALDRLMNGASNTALVEHVHAAARDCQFHITTETSCTAQRTLVSRSQGRMASDHGTLTLQACDTGVDCVGWSQDLPPTLQNGTALQPLQLRRQLPAILLQPLVTIALAVGKLQKSPPANVDCDYPVIGASSYLELVLDHYMAWQLPLKPWDKLTTFLAAA